MRGTWVFRGGREGQAGNGTCSVLTCECMDRAFVTQLQAAYDERVMDCTCDPLPFQTFLLLPSLCCGSAHVPVAARYCPA